MIPAYIALTALTDRLRMDELACAAAALQIQVTGDFAPEWAPSPLLRQCRSRSWSLTASHMVLQMLANPTGAARRPGIGVKIAGGGWEAASSRHGGYPGQA